MFHCQDIRTFPLSDSHAASKVFHNVLLFCKDNSSVSLSIFFYLFASAEATFQTTIDVVNTEHNCPILICVRNEQFEMNSLIIIQLLYPFRLRYVRLLHLFRSKFLMYMNTKVIWSLENFTHHYNWDFFLFDAAL